MKPIELLPKGHFTRVQFKMKRTLRATKREITNLRVDLSQKISSLEIKNESLLLLAINEVLTNIAEHGHNFSSKEKIVFHIFISEKKAGVVIYDTSAPFDPNKNKAKSPKKQFDKGADGGYGMFIYKRVFHKISYQAEKEQNTLILLFDDTKISL